MIGVVKSWSRRLLFSKRYVFSLLLSAAVVFAMSAAERKFPTAAFSAGRIITLGMILFLTQYGFSVTEQFFRMRRKEAFFLLRTFPISTGALFAAMFVSALPGWLTGCVCALLTAAGFPGVSFNPLSLFASALFPGMMLYFFSVLLAFLVNKERTLHAVYVLLTAGFFFLNGFWLEPVFEPVSVILYFPSMLIFEVISSTLSESGFCFGTEHAVLLLLTVGIGIASYAVFAKKSGSLL